MEAYMNDIANDSFELSRRKASLYVEKCMMEIENDINSLEILERTSTYKSVFEDAAQQNAVNAQTEEKKKSLAGRIIDKIIGILSKIVDAIKEFFYNIKASFGHSLTVEDYMSSNTVKLEFEEDMRQIATFVDQQYAEARPIVSRIAKLTNTDVLKVEKWCDAVSNFAVKKGKFVLKAAATVGFCKMLERTLSKHLKLSDEFKAAMDKMKGKNLDPNKKYGILSRFANGMMGLSEIALGGLNEIYKTTDMVTKVSKREGKRERKRRFKQKIFGKRG